MATGSENAIVPRFLRLRVWTRAASGPSRRASLKWCALHDIYGHLLRGDGY